MIRNYLLITWRSMMKNKMFIFINIFGLAIGIACCIVAYFNWEYDVMFDSHHVNAKNTYRISSVREFNNVTTLYGHAPGPLGEVIRHNISDVDKVVRINHSWSNFKVEDNLFPGQLGYADADLFNVFSFEFISGNPDELKDKSKVFLSDEMALKLFNTTDAVGKQLTQVVGTVLKEFQVGGVFKKQPSNSSFHWQAFMNFENYYDEARGLKEDDWKNHNTIFVHIKEPARVAVVSKQIQQYIENNNKVREDFQIKEYVLDPFEGMARRDSANETWSQTTSANNRAAVVAPGFMAVLVLLIACFNMTNTAIAISSRRLKEIGVRKVMGSLRSQLIAQFLGETFFICTIALLLGLFFGEVLLNAWNSLWVNMKLTSHYIDNPAFVIFIVCTLLVTALIAGSYPAFYISHFEPVSILKGKLKFGGTNVFTRALLALQYSISLLAIIFAIAFYQNSKYQRAFDIGFNPNNVIIAYVENGNEYETYKNTLLQNKDINLIAGSTHSLFSAGYNDPVKYESQQLEVDIIEVGDEYLKALDLKLIKGRDFQKDSETDKRESIIVSEKLVRSFGWDDPIGKEIKWMDTVKLFVVGVVKDVYTNGLWRENEPLMIRYTSKDKYTHVVVNMPSDKVKDVDKFMEASWKDVFPNRLYNGRVINEDMVEADTVNNNIVKMFGFLGAVALLLSATGLFTLVSLNIIKKMKEIGVRKVLGASIGNITRIINTEFVVILVIASLLGSTVSFLLVDALMGSIWKYYQSTTELTLIASVSIMFLISAIAIGYKVFSAASMNPVNTLRTE
ncbi:ABC transporter permease [Chryseosolibacter indicus]|uniref:ABC transporter permease n=1 Tax=Chryseosolibacter indicus TaxID=2782351 RepID=A0ABS5VTC1_9BACT|nr:ABC transporter permease [Chryseosolibacter indicus]MBT1704014.1 ABC transporter permease [Chryseosolibacter indicus]